MPRRGVKVNSGSSLLVLMVKPLKDYRTSVARTLWTNMLQKYNNYITKSYLSQGEI